VTPTIRDTPAIHPIVIAGIEIAIIQTVDNKRHEDAALRRVARNVLTMSCQQAWYRVAFVSHQAIVLWSICSHLFRSSRTSKRRNRYANVRYSSQYARLRDVLMLSPIPTDSDAHFMPRQLRGPFEKATSQLSKDLDSG
jgi:hypothetical protein